MNWVALTAIATSIIAVMVIFLFGAIWNFMRRAAHVMDSVSAFVDGLERETRPALETAKTLISDTQRVAGRLSREVEHIVDTSEDIRSRVGEAVDAIEDRLVDLNSLVDVIQEEVEETVLDVGAALRVTRRSGAILGTMKRALFGGSKRRRRRG
jgi:uncharacterized protein YoxC